MVDYKHPVNPGLLGSRWHDPKRRHLHMGDDYRIGTGHFVRAIADGVVRVVNQHRLWGFHVQIEHADGRVSSYHQLQRLGRPWVGDRLRQGDVVGRVGNPCIGWTQAQKEESVMWAGQVERDSSGNLVSTGPHFHLGILEAYGKPWINPATVITTKATAAEQAGSSGTPIEPIPEDDEPRGPKIMGGAEMAQLFINKSTNTIYWAGDLTWVRTSTAEECNALGRLSGQFNPSVFQDKANGETLDGAVRRVLEATGYIATAEELNIMRKRIDANRKSMGLTLIDSSQY